MNYTLTANVEALYLVNNARVGTGNALDNALYGTNFSDTLSGLDGNDVLKGYAGDDTLLCVAAATTTGDELADRLSELAGLREPSESSSERTIDAGHDDA